MSNLPMDVWREWSRTDDRLQKFVLSDIRQMIGEIDRLRRENRHLNDLIDGYKQLVKST